MTSQRERAPAWQAASVPDSSSGPAYSGPRWWPPRWWAGRSGPEAVDLYTRGPLYLLSGSELVVPFLLGEGTVASPVAVATLTVVGLVHAVACLALLRAGLARYLDHRAVPRNVVLGVIAVTVLAGAAVLLLVPGASRFSADSPAALGLHLLIVYTLAAFTPLLTIRYLGVVALVVTAAYGLTSLLQGSGREQALELVWTAFPLLLAVLVVYRPSIWLLGVVWQLDDAQRTRARLAVAEERLRFARDLHDALGGKLSAIAVKSELAAELARRGKDTATEQALEVRTIANEALAEVREVVRGYRQVDLDAEIAGSRALLQAAGVGCRTVGEAGGLDPDVQAALGWVVREGTTNVLRHSDAAHCTLTLRSGLERVSLTIENDGARVAAHPGGSGLLGLGERLAPLGGEVRGTVRPPDRFVLTADLPVTGGAR